MEEVVLQEYKEGVLTLWLNRPEVLNAFNRELASGLVQGIRRAVADAQIRVVVIRGKGRGFCSGQDLSVALDERAGRIRDIVREMYNPLIQAMRDLPKPIIASIGGVAAGAGMSLALAADLRVASTSARFVYGFSGIGLAPDSGASYYLPRIIGVARALEFSMLGGSVNAEQALALGLVSKVVPDDALMAETDTLARRLAAGPTVALGLTKRAMYEGATGALTDALEREALYQQLASETQDFKEGVKAFLEKRVPDYKGC
ncbi:enoyl-CoA hydratase-related protein [Sulfoacidibacillus thermotolerans]|uniref:enoyl-CoA hydratase-related protein n=1 Tax=Sulfoacidibacillus thermotolerans TaxID=1765684 RepID=UPI001FEA4C2C|nr:enoyl-CoA hydratase-related protein [Sulfoacidibacillus thermotolerans]